MIMARRFTLCSDFGSLIFLIDVFLYDFGRSILTTNSLNVDCQAIIASAVLLASDFLSLVNLSDRQPKIKVGGINLTRYMNLNSSSRWCIYDRTYGEI